MIKWLQFYSKTFSNLFPWLKIVAYSFKFHWNLFPRVHYKIPASYIQYIMRIKETMNSRMISHLLPPQVRCNVGCLLWAFWRILLSYNGIQLYHTKVLATAATLTWFCGKSWLLLDGHFLTWILIGRQHSCQPIRIHVTKLLSDKSEFNREPFLVMTTSRLGVTKTISFIL